MPDRTTSDHTPPPPTGAVPISGADERRILGSYVGAETDRAVLSRPVEIVPYDPDWLAHYDREAQRITAALGPAVLGLEHIGSTSVPGLSAKPCVDIVLQVADVCDEDAFLPALRAAGYRLVIREREPDWYDHAVLKGPDININLHVYTAGCPEPRRSLAFRDRLRADPADLARYQQVKLDLAGRRWSYVQQYSDAKNDVIDSIMAGVDAPPRRP
jgi:GrpB-like predicted nucleotidyltransferase (UPF0157 family)